MKQYVVKVYDSSENFLTEWTDELINEPTFTQEINSPSSEMVLKLARSVTDFGEEEDVAFNNIVKIYVKDFELASPTIMFQGYIADYYPIFKENEYVEVHVFPYDNQLQDIIHGEDETANQTQLTGSQDYDISNNVAVAQSFVPSVTSISSVDLKMYVQVPTNVTLSIQTDNSGSPSGSAVTGSTITKTITDTTAAVQRFIYGTPVAVSNGTTYWLVITA